MSDRWSEFHARVHPHPGALAGAGGGAFEPPDREAVVDLLRAYPPEPSGAWERWLPLGVVVVAVGVGVLSPGAWGWVLPWPVLIGGLGVLQWRSGVKRGRVRSAERMRDLLLLRRYAEALRLGWRSLPGLAGMPAMWVQAVGVMGESLEAVGAHGSAAACFETLAEVLPDDHPMRGRLAAARAVAALRDDRLADADDALRRARSWRGAGDAASEGDRASAMELGVATLYQRVRTHHFAAGAELADELRPGLGALGLAGAYGHGLAALCYRQAGRAEDAAAAWDDATALLPGWALVHGFAELGVMAGEGADATAAEAAEPRGARDEGVGDG